MAYELALVRVSKIIETEEHIPERVVWLLDKIQSEGVWRVPLVLDKQSYGIMDGHHRFNVALKLGLRNVPAIMISYNDSRVKVESWRDDFVVNKQVVMEYITQKKKFPHKTTRHIINPHPEEIEIPISLLY